LIVSHDTVADSPLPALNPTPETDESPITVAGRKRGYKRGRKYLELSPDDPEPPTSKRKSPRPRQDTLLSPWVKVNDEVRPCYFNEIGGTLLIDLVTGSTCIIRECI
jgi:hypothetical protein